MSNDAFKKRLREMSDKRRTALGLIVIEARYHLRVMAYLNFKQKVRYLYKQVWERDCERRELCLGRASLKYLSTHHRDELSNYAFLCDRCHTEAQKVLEEWWENYLKEEEKRLSMTAELKIEWTDEKIEAKRAGSRSTKNT